MFIRLKYKTDQEYTPGPTYHTEKQYDNLKKTLKKG